MKFNSKTQLSEHIKELEKAGYLKKHWLYIRNEEISLKPKKGFNKARKFLTVNFEAIKK